MAAPCHTAALGLQGARVIRERRLVASNLLDEALGVLAADVDLKRDAERKVGRERVVHDGVHEHDAEDDADILRCRDGSSGPPPNAGVSRWPPLTLALERRAVGSDYLAPGDLTSS